MTEEQKLILSCILLLVSVIALIIVFVYTKKVINKEKEIVDELEKKTYEYYKNLQLKDGKYFPYYHTHAFGIRGDRKSLGDKDNITGITIGKHKRFYFDRILYIFNEKLHIALDKETIDNQEYIIINNKIKKIELLVSFEKPSHFLVKYNVIKDKEGYKLELDEKEVSLDESRRT